MSQIAIHAVIVVTLAVCYTVIATTGHDGTGLLLVLGGYVGGAGSTFLVARTNGGISPK